MRVAIMQPYFLPYIGYYQLISAVDVFVIYDNIKYTKKGWINRNRLLVNGTDATFSLPLKKDSDALDVRDRSLAADFNRDKLLNQFRGAYGRAPHFAEVFPVIEQIVRHDDANLFRFVRHALVRTCEYLGIRTEIRVSSSIEIDHGLKNQDKVLALCKALDAATYVNAAGGLELYSKPTFSEQGLDLKFVRSKASEYLQFGGPFVPWLSIVDAMMFNPVETISNQFLTQFELV